MKTLFAIFFLIIAITASAQERQIPIDKGGKIFEIDAELESKLKLFPEYQEFSEAHLYQSTDTSFVLEISYMTDNRRNKARVTMNAEEAMAFREKVTLLINERAHYININQEGRAEMLVGTTLMGFGFWGWAIPSAMDIDDGRLTASMYLLTSAASFFVPYWLTENRPVSDAAARLSVYGGMSGILHGFLLYHGIKKEPENTFNQYDDYVKKTYDDYALAAFLSILETLGGYMIATGTDMTAGKADVLTGMSTMGFFYGLGISGLTDNFGSSGDWRLISLGGMGLGYLAGNIIANSHNYTRGDSYVLTTGGYLGGFSLITLIAIADVKDAKSYAAAALAGMTGGLFLGNHLAKGKDFTTSQGVYMSLGAFAGGLLGGGVGLLFMPKDGDAGPKLVMTMVALGANMGYFMLYNTFKDRATVPPSTTNNFQIDFNPAAAAIQLTSKTQTNFHLPCLSVRYKF